MGQYFSEQPNYVNELMEALALIDDIFFTLLAISDKKFNSPIKLKSELKNRLNNYKTIIKDDILLKLKYNINSLNQKYFKYSNAKFSLDTKNIKNIGEYINYLSIIKSYSKIYTFTNEYKSSLNEALSIFNKIKSLNNNQPKYNHNHNNMDIEIDNNHNNLHNNYNNSESYCVQAVKSKQKEEQMMAGDNIGRMLSSAEGLANICNKKNLFIKYQNYDFFDSRNVKNENQLMEQLMSQIEFAEINYSLYIKDYKQPFPFDEENNLKTICKDIDNMRKVVPQKYKYLYTAMINLLLRKDNSEFLKKLEDYDNNNNQPSKMDPKIIGAYGVPIVNYHYEKKERANEEKGNTYKFNLGANKDPYKDIISSQGKNNVELFEDAVNFSNL